MSDWECKFCGSKQLRLNRGNEVKLKGFDSEGQPEYEAVTDFCCGAQRDNALYIKKNFHPDDAPDPDDVSRI